MLSAGVGAARDGVGDEPRRRPKHGQVGAGARTHGRGRWWLPPAPASVLSTTAISDEGCGHGGHGGELDRGGGSTCATGASYCYLREHGERGKGSGAHSRAIGDGRGLGVALVRPNRRRRAAGQRLKKTLIRSRWRSPASSLKAWSTKMLTTELLDDLAGHGEDGGRGIDGGHGDHELERAPSRKREGMGKSEWG